MIGILYIAIGSLSGSSFYIPFRKVKGWAWESYWISQGVAAWLVAPWLFALLTVPPGTLMDILHDAPASAKWLTIMFGALWGVGGLSFGLSIRYLGIALGQSVVLGLAAAMGTLIPFIVAGEDLFTSRVGILTLVGVAIVLAGIAIIAYAGVLKDKSLSEKERKAAVKDFALKKGILIATLSGVMSACINYGFTSGKAIDEVALQYGTNELFVSNPTLIFILLGGFAVNFIYCLFLNIKNKTYRDYTHASASVFLNNIAFTFLAGFLWFMQFQFYGMGKGQVPASMEAFAWSIMMAMVIAFSNIWGLILKEWKGASKKNLVVLFIGITVLILSIFIIKFN